MSCEGTLELSLLCLPAESSTAALVLIRLRIGHLGNDLRSVIDRSLIVFSFPGLFRIRDVFCFGYVTLLGNFQHARDARLLLVLVCHAMSPR